VWRPATTSERPDAGLGEGHADALAEQESPEVGVVYLFRLAGVLHRAVVEVVAVEPLDPADVALQVIQDAALGRRLLLQELEQRRHDEVGEPAGHRVDVAVSARQSQGVLQHEAALALVAAIGFPWRCSGDALE
jgi:hypothetical protein